MSQQDGNNDVPQTPNDVPQTPNDVPQTPHDRPHPQLNVAEYTALRAETLLRITTQNQILTLALLAPGTVLGVGVRLNDPVLILLYPFFAVFLSLLWAHNDYRKRQIGWYIKENIEEEQFERGKGWEHYLVNTHDSTHSFRLHYLASRGLLIGTALLALVAGMSEAHFLAWIPQILTSWLKGTPVAFDITQIDPRDVALGLLANFWLTFLTVVAFFSTIAIVLIIGWTESKAHLFRSKQQEEKTNLKRERRGWFRRSSASQVAQAEAQT